MFAPREQVQCLYSYSMRMPLLNCLKKEAYTCDMRMCIFQRLTMPNKKRINAMDEVRRFLKEDVDPPGFAVDVLKEKVYIIWLINLLVFV